MRQAKSSYRSSARARELAMERYRRLKAEGRCVSCGKRDYYTSVRRYVRCEVCTCVAYGGTKEEIRALRERLEQDSDPDEYKGRRRYYTVYDKKTDLPVCSGTSEECADFLEIRRNSFYSMVSRAKYGLGRYEFFKESLDDVEAEDDTESIENERE